MLRRMKAALPLPLRKLPRWVQIRLMSDIPLFQRVVIELQSHCNRDCYFCCRESDTSGKRKLADGRSVLQAMPTHKVMSLLDELETLGFKGFITFHQLSEAFLDKRLMDVARNAKRRGMRPYVHTNGDVLRHDAQLCAEAAGVFDYIVVGLYDYTSRPEKEAEKEFWRARLRGTQIMFSLAEQVYVRTHSAANAQMSALDRRTHPTGVCADPLRYLLIHYNGDVAYCCEDMYGEVSKLNIFETSIRDVWYGARHAKIVKTLLMGDRQEFDLCAKCTMGPNRYSKDPMHETRHFDR